MVEMIPSIEHQPSQTLGIIMEAASALSSIGGTEEPRTLLTNQHEQPAPDSLNLDSSVPLLASRSGAKPCSTDSKIDEAQYEVAPAAVENAVRLSGEGEPGVTDLDPSEPDASHDKNMRADGTEIDSSSKTENHETFNFTTDADGQPKRYLPDNKKPDAAPTFPEKLMKMMKWATAEGVSCVQWVDDGKSFVINQPDVFTRDVVPRFFKATKFSSFTRKLYRWGFRQVNRGIGPEDPIIFGNDFFQRDNEELMCKMKSVTAASARKQDVKTPFMDQSLVSMKHGLDVPTDEQTAKRMMMTNAFYQQKADMMAASQQNSSMYGLMSTHGQLSLTNALRPANMGTYQNNQGLIQMQPFSQSMQMPMAMNSTDNVHQQLLQLHQMQMLNQDGLPGHMQDSMIPNNDFLQQQQQQQLALQMPQQQAMSMQPQYSQLAMPAFQPMNTSVQAQQMMGNTSNLYDFIPQNSYANPGSTVEIVNAAISALRYAN